MICSGDSFDDAGEEAQRWLRIRRLEDATRRASTLGVSINVKSVANQAKFFKWGKGPYVLEASVACGIGLGSASDPNPPSKSILPSYNLCVTTTRILLQALSLQRMEE